MRALLVLSFASMAMAVAPVVTSAAAPGNKVTICHATSSSSNPYVKVVVDRGSVQDRSHRNHSGDIIDPPGGECPTGTPGNGNGNPGNGNGNNGGGNDGKITICHATGSATNPYQELTVPANSGHNGHAGDIIPAPPGGCPNAGYNPDDIEARAQFVGDGQVQFSFRGCPKGGKVGVTIGGATVAGSPFTVPSTDVLQQTVAIPAGATGDVIQFTCDRPVIVWEVVIGETDPVQLASSAPKQAQPTSLANPASSQPGNKGGNKGGNSGSVPARQLGFGFGSLAGLVAFGGLRRGGMKLPSLD